ncbi:MAG: M90 family metallopeptidase [Bacteroidota bacterium]
MLGLFFIVLVVALAVFLTLTRRKKERVKLPDLKIVSGILQRRVAYYNRLPAPEQIRFQKEVAEFLRLVKVTGIGTTVTDEDRVLVAASGIIPIFAFPGWKYPNLNEVLLYPDTFSREFEFDTDPEDRNVLGMVGNGGMDNMMILSKPSLHHGFNSINHTSNTAIHEFVHLVDKADGVIDGIPSWLIDKENAMPWLHLIHKNIQAIRENNSDINPYGATNESEFFAVASEYFFSTPLLFKERHPELYEMLEKIFRQDPGQLAIGNRE